MRERGDLTVLQEPFMYHNYLTTKDRKFPDFGPEPGHPTTHSETRAMILRKIKGGPVFFEVMAFYVDDALPMDAEFAGQMTHAFLLRDPNDAALSYVRRDTAFTRTELGHEAQVRLYHALVAQGHEPLVVTADQLRTDPEVTLHRYWTYAGLSFADNAFACDNRGSTGWQAVQGWHGKALQSDAIQNPDQGNAATDLAALDEPYVDHAACHAPFYEEMREIAETQAHQR